MVTEEMVVNHPTYNLLKASYGEHTAMKFVRDQLNEAAKGNQSNVEKTDTNKIVIPFSMTKLDASKELKRQWNDEENIVDVSRNFGMWNWREVLVAANTVMKAEFGWVDGKAIRTFFGTQYPREIEIVTDINNGVKTTETCFYGHVNIGPWEAADMNIGGNNISCEVKKRYKGDVKKFYDKIEQELSTNSIYRGKSIVVKQVEDPWGNISLSYDIIEINPSDKIVLNKDVRSIIDIFILDELGEPGKKCHLFSGGYGNGKTETAMEVGRRANEKGMSFFYVKDARAFQNLLGQSVNYQPCVVFLEDVDEITSGEQRDSKMNEILNTLDGVQTKGKDLTVIFTTNHENRINKALRRPGRIDTVVHFENPNDLAKEDIFRLYLSHLDTGNELNYTELAEMTGDVPGAVVAEISKRAVKLCKKRNECNTEVVQAAISSIQHHLKLMNDTPEKTSLGDMDISIKGASITMEQAQSN